MEPAADDKAADLDDSPPILGSWGRLYTAVLASAVAVMILIAVFSHWAF